MGYYPVIGMYENKAIKYTRGAMIDILKTYIPRMTDRQLKEIFHKGSVDRLKGDFFYYMYYDNLIEKGPFIKPYYYKEHIDDFVAKMHTHLKEICDTEIKQEAVDITSLTQVAMMLNELSSLQVLQLRDLIYHEIELRGCEDSYYLSKGRDPMVATDRWGNHKLFFYNVEAAADFFNLHPHKVADCMRQGIMVEQMYLKRIDIEDIPPRMDKRSLDKDDEYPNEDKKHLATNPNTGR